MKRLALARRGDEGSAQIEFALMALGFVMLLMGVFELGRMVLVYNTLANAAKVGTRYAIVHGGDRTGSGADGPSGPGGYSQIQTVVQNYASAGLLDTTKLNVAVNYPTSSNQAGSPVQVTVSYTYDPWISYFNSQLSVSLGSTSEGVITF